MPDSSFVIDPSIHSSIHPFVRSTVPWNTEDPSHPVPDHPAWHWFFLVLVSHLDLFEPLGQQLDVCHSQTWIKGDYQSARIKGDIIVARIICQAGCVLPAAYSVTHVIVVMSIMTATK